jgi:hypothetical protein
MERGASFDSIAFKLYEILEFEISVVNFLVIFALINFLMIIMLLTYHKIFFVIKCLNLILIIYIQINISMNFKFNSKTFKTYLK